MATTILEALEELDQDNDAHWTMDGAPRLDALEEILGHQVSRKEVIDVSPKFMRQPTAPSEEPEVATEATPEAPIDKEDEANDETDPPSTNAEPESPVEDVEAPKEPEAIDPPTNFRQALELIAGNMELLQEALAEGTEQMLRAQREATEARARADELANMVNTINRKIEHLTKSDPNHNTAGIRAYIDQQNKNRMARVAGLHRFQEMTKIDARDLAKAIDPRAPIDRAMSARKPALGSQRPPIRRV